MVKQPLESSLRRGSKATLKGCNWGPMCKTNVFPSSAVTFSQCFTECFLETERDLSEKVKNYHLIPAVLHVFILWQ